MAKTYKDETLEMAIVRAEELHTAFVEEVRRLLNSGAVDLDRHNRGMLFGVALENLSDGFLRGDRSGKDYKNLKCF